MVLNPEAQEKVWLPVRQPNCKLCPLHKEAKTVCLLGDGPVPNNIMVIGEAPGAREDDIERPFSGVAGQYLDRVLTSIGLPREKLYITNAVRCRPPDNRTPTPSEIKTCATYLNRELEIVNPQFVLLLGNAALRAVLGTSGIMSKRGTVTERNGRQVFATVHPAAVLRNPALENAFKSDLQGFKRLVDGQTQKPKTTTRLIRTSAALSQFCQLLATVDTPIAFDVETGSLNPEELQGGLFPWHPNGVIHTVAFCWEPGTSYVVAPEHPAVQWDIPVERVYEALGIALAGKKMVGHNLKFDLSWMLSKGVNLYGHFDTMLALHLLDENSPLGLKPNARSYLGADEYEAGITFGPTAGALANLAIYNAKDADYTLRLYHILRDKLKAQSKLARLFIKLTMPACRAFVNIERNGFPVDVERLGIRHREILNKIDEITAKLITYVPDDHPGPINFRSPIFLGWWLFDHLKLPVLLVTPKAGRPSTAETVLLELRKKHPAVNLLMELRKWQKYESTYTRNWHARIRSAGRPRLHTSYKLAGTVTGRLSSDMQQVPRDVYIRSIIGTPTGWKLIEADFSQIELRIAAMLSRDAALRTAFTTGGDPHRETAARMLGKPPAEVTAEERKMAKAVNFGFLYGMGARKFKTYAKEKYEIEVSDSEAQAYRKAFFAQYASLKPWHERQRRLVHQNGQVHSPIGRIRHLPAINSTDEMMQAEAEREAINSPVQGFASDLTVLAMTLLMDKLDGSRCRLIGNVHDSIMAEATDDYAREAAKIIKETMETLPIREFFGYQLTVPIEAEVKITQHWGESLP
jgi:DNA polymerase-1